MQGRPGTGGRARWSTCTSREQKSFTFLEVNTRLQVEHPITEVTTGLDLVKLQIFVAERGRAGGRLSGGVRACGGGAAERRGCGQRVRAVAGRWCELLNLPVGPGIRVDTGIASGDVIPPDYDSMVAKIIAWGRDRNEALARLRIALRETTVVVMGGTDQQVVPAGAAGPAPR